MSSKPYVRLAKPGYPKFLALVTFGFGAARKARGDSIGDGVPTPSDAASPTRAEIVRLVRGYPPVLGAMLLVDGVITLGAFPDLRSVAPKIVRAFLRDRFSEDDFGCALFARIRQTVDLYAKNYEDRFQKIAETAPALRARHADEPRRGGTAQPGDA